MATNASPFIVNIVELQNIATSVTGTSDTSLLSKAQSDIANLQLMVDFQTKTISTDIINSFTQGQAIDVMANLNLSNASLYSNSNVVSLNTSGTTASSAATISTIGGTNTKLVIDNLANTISFITAGTQSFQMNSSSIASFTSDVYVGGNLFVNSLIHTSDKELKNDIKPFSTSVNDVLKLESKQFTWKSNNSADIGFIAQEVQAVWPELTQVGPSGSIGIAYSRMFPLLIESIRELNNRILYLESLQNLENIENLDNIVLKLESHLRDTPAILDNGSTGGNE